jgi:hypothetical protein
LSNVKSVLGQGVQGSRFRVQGSGFKVQGSRFRVQGSAPPPAKKTAGLIEKETLKKRISIFCGSLFQLCVSYEVSGS